MGAPIRQQTGTRILTASEISVILNRASLEFIKIDNRHVFIVRGELHGLENCGERADLIATRRLRHEEALGCIRRKFGMAANGVRISFADERWS